MANRYFGGYEPRLQCSGSQVCTVSLAQQEEQKNPHPFLGEDEPSLGLGTPLHPTVFFLPPFTQIPLQSLTLGPSSPVPSTLPLKLSQV